MNENYSLTGAHLIAGEFVSCDAGGVRAVNPTTGIALEPPICQAGPQEADAAFAAATAAFAATRGLAAERWAALLEAIAAESEALIEPMVARAMQESALPEARLRGEMGRTTGQLRLFAKIVRDGDWLDAVIDRADPDRKPLPRADIRRMMRPLGPVVVFDASNFPFAFGACGGDTASALAAGNPVIVKGHPGHPGVGELFAEAVRRALKTCELPMGLFALLQGAGHKIGATLVTHPAAAAVAFTGSQRAGRALFDLAATRPRPIPVFAEMGSVNPLVALPGALAERREAIADGLAASVTMGVGQFCTKPGVVFYVAGSTGDAFAELLRARLAAAPSGTLLNSTIRDHHAAILAKQRDIEGVRSAVIGSPSGCAGESPTLLVIDSQLFRERQELREEAFGPSALLVRCADVNDILSSIGALEGQLTGTLHTGAGDSEADIRAVACALEASVGRLIFNGYPTGVEVGRAMVHGGPYPATTAPGTTSVGTLAITRFARPVSFQSVPDALLPPELQNANPCGISRTVDSVRTTAAIE